MRISTIFFITIGAFGFILNPNEKRALIDSKPHGIAETNKIDSIFDDRDSNWYKVVKVNSLYWFNENLSFKSADSRTIISNEKTAMVTMYSFNESKNVCPSGWRLPTTKEFDQLINSTFNTSFYGHETIKYNWQSINNNASGFQFDHTGFLHKKKTMSKESFNIWLDDMDTQNAYHVHMYDTNQKDHNNNLTVFRHTHKKHNPKKNRKFAVRCVCNANTQEELKRH